MDRDPPADRAERIYDTPWGSLCDSSFNHIAIAEAAAMAFRERVQTSIAVLPPSGCHICYDEEVLEHGHYQVAGCRVCIPCALKASEVDLAKPADES